MTHRSKAIKRAHRNATSVLLSYEDKNGVTRYRRKKTEYVPLKVFARELAKTPPRNREGGIHDIAADWLRGK